MRVLAVVVLVAALVMCAFGLYAHASETGKRGSSVEEQFLAFGLIGEWAGDCAKPASPENPHVRVAVDAKGAVVEEHDLGRDYVPNRYDIVAAQRLDPARISITVVYKPSSDQPERQKLILLVRGNTRRTMFNQPEGGAVRVKDGIVVGRGAETPVLKKCK